MREFIFIDGSNEKNKIKNNNKNIWFAQLYGMRTK